MGKKEKKETGPGEGHKKQFCGFHSIRHVAKQAPDARAKIDSPLLLLALGLCDLLEGR